MREIESFLNMASFADYSFFTRQIADTNKCEIDEQAVSIIDEMALEQYDFFTSIWHRFYFSLSGRPQATALKSR